MPVNVMYMLDAAAEKYGSRTALSDEKESITYSEYKELAGRIGSYIAAHGRGAERRAVIVLADRNVKSVVTFLGVASSGNYYVPVDGSVPAERLKLICEKTEPLMMIDARTKGTATEGALAFDEVSGDAADAELLEKIKSGINDSDPLLVIFTSGSTGVPKGVIKSHRSVISMCEVFSGLFSFDADCVFGNQAAFDFDVSTKDIYNALYAGAGIEILSKKCFKFPGLLVQAIKERKIDTMMWAVSALRVLADNKSLDGCGDLAIKRIMFSGEQMPVKALNYLRAHIPGCSFVNLYGPSEISGNCTYHVIDRDYAEDEILPIGRPVPNTAVFLLKDRRERVSAPGEKAEICFCGSSMAMGYVNDPERTAEVFIQDPGNRAYPSRIYTTGDIGYYGEDGELYFAGRADSQIKHMGHRIELGEVEAVLNSVHEVDVGCCIHDKDRQEIVCFYQAARECRKEIVAAMAGKLPKYMWPTVYVHYVSIPVNRNSKIDRALLTQKVKEGNYNG